ncbi:membrane protein [Gordonia phage Burley]|uniref:Uncharacterized protein n=1 Tax=Gordonia phage Untouchable TaxID=2656542 RepID=A0A649V9T8_9CAUD|nr:hypothetical protein HWC79_gp77 [Gordonia phage Untouchable]QXO14678.1 membrane protein [Gordonia phage Runhaar]USH44736.1 membrane protein [Gordonia phage Burley]UVK64039.1 hypothetical protein SEA_VARDY_74 [Gordonia phage Vardy]WAB10461.1 hypothetical protein SEA_PHEPPER_76 [Gordonia phage Phepper]QGJ89118.1 hypothetical protein PBI_UNTOUCHABLE_77 [Gordonia phage Untouchable]
MKYKNFLFILLVTFLAVVVFLLTITFFDTIDNTERECKMIGKITTCEVKP